MEKIMEKKFRPKAIEVCCGHAGLSVALQRLGWDVRPIDWVGNEHKPKIPVMHKDLRNPTHIADIMKMLKTISYLHFAPLVAQPARPGTGGG